MNSDDKPNEFHPSYGMVSISRVSSGGQNSLFGSSLDSHITSFRLRINGGYINNSMGSRWYAADNQNRVVEIALSAAQFSELITSINGGEGVPCTILSREGKIVDSPPVQTTERNSIKEDFELRIKQLFSKLAALQKETNEVLDKPSILKSDRQSLRHKIEQLRMEVEQNVPFMVELFDEATDKTVSAAKQEVDTFMTNTLVNLGLEKLESVSLISDATNPRLPNGS